MSNKKITVSTRVSEPLACQIDDRWFGAVQTGFYDFSGFQSADVTVGITTIRWPGGHLSETQPAVYGLDIHGLFDARELWIYNPNRLRPDLESSFEYAIENDAEFSMIIPTARYAHDINLGEAHLRAFLKDLLSGEYGGIPKHLTLEIGNEYKAQENFKDDANLYGFVASRFTEIINQEFSVGSAFADRSKITVAVQMGVDEIDNQKIISEFSESALANVDSVIFHALPISLLNLTRPSPEEEGKTHAERIKDYYEDWAQVISEFSSDELELFMSAWTVGGSSNSPVGIDLEWHDYGLRGASTVLEIFAAYSCIGTDAAAVWGINAGNLNSLYHMDDGTPVISHTGMMFGWLSNSLPGMSFLGDYSPASRDDDFLHYSFGDGSNIASYLVANNTDNAATLTFLLDGVYNFSIQSSKLMTTEINDDFDGSIDDLDARINELVILDSPEYYLSEYGIVIDFDEDFEIAEFFFEFGQGTLGTKDEDWIMGSHFSDEIIGFGSNDYLQGISGDDTIFGGTGADTILGGTGNDFIDGGVGSDSLFGETGQDTALGGAGNDTLDGAAGRDTLLGQAGDDSLLGGAGNDVLNGDAGNDTLRGGGDNDVLRGGAQEDLLFGDTGNDTLLGDAGFDTLLGGAGNDLLDGGGQADNLLGQGGDDSLHGGDGDDILCGGTQEDQLFGDSGNDTLRGDAGFDWLEGGADDDLLDGGAQADNLFGGAGNDTLLGGAGFDRLFGGDDDDLGYGGSGPDALLGQAGNDSLYGQSGNDRMFGGTGNDLIDGGSWDDTLLGGAGFDTLVGSTGNDNLTGAFNADTFVFADFGSGFGQDTITDFDALSIFERIDLVHVGAITDYADLVANHMTQVGADVVIDDLAGNTIKIVGVSRSNLDANDFVF